MVDLIWIGVALLLAPALAEIAKFRHKGFTWVGAGGVMYLLAVAFTYDVGFGLTAILTYGTALFTILGLVSVLIGTLMIAMSLFK